MSIREAMRAKNQEQPEREHNPNCSAHGCPMRGSIAATTHAGEGTRWYCRFHFGEPVEAFDGITQTIRSRLASESKAKEDHTAYLQKVFGVKQ